MKSLKSALLTTVLMVSLGQAANAEYSKDQLATLQSLVSAGNAKAIVSFVKQNPGLAAGNTPLATQLRSFVKSQSGILGGIFGMKPNALSATVSSTAADAGIADTGSLGDFGS